ncbi:intersectin-1-like [Diadema setosum]|uniref:intersectin-1-like n=1 Tax=Diadema setosum TaxID=31175 RepID=UPI003B3B1B93
MMQGGGMHQEWRITAEDRAKHDAQFLQLKPISGYISGDAARGFFLQSGLPQQVLGHIWTLSDMNADGKLDKLEFSIAMFLIKKKLSGVELPRVLPQSLKQTPAPAMGGFGAQPMGMVRPMSGFGAMPGMQMGVQGGGVGVQPGGFNPLPSRTGGIGGFGTVPAQQNVMARAGSVQSSPERGRSSSIGGEWSVPHNSKLKFTQMFNTQDRTRSGFLTGAQARNVLVQSGLGQAHLAQIWGLADVDNDGRLTCEEFCLALHLVDMVKSGKTLPQTLPPDLVPPSYRRGRSSSLTAVGVPPTPAPAPAMPTAGMMASMGGGPMGSAPLGPTPLGPTPLGGAPMGGAPMGGAPMGGGMMCGVGVGAMPGMPAMGGGVGGLAMPMSPSMAKQGSVDEQQPPAEEEKKFTPVTFEDRKRMNFEKGQQELERRRAALREVQEREKERQRDLEKQEQERKERIRMEQERRRQLELERQMQKQREIEAEREAQRRKMEEQREAARRELERQRQLEIERQKRQELEAKRIKSQEEVCHLKATSKTLACEIETLEDKKNELNKKINESNGFVKEHQTSIILLSQNRDAKVAEIDQLQQKIQELRQFKQQRAQQKEELQVQAKKLNINLQVSDTYAAVMTSYSNKQKTLEKLKEALRDVEKKTAQSLQDTDSNHSKLSDLKASLAREQGELDQLKRAYQTKMADYQRTKKRLEEEKRQALVKQSVAQNRENERIKQETLHKKKEEEEKQKKSQQFEAIRIAQQQAEREKGRKEEEQKKKGEEKSTTSANNIDPFAAFGSSANDPFASAFDNGASTTSKDPNDPFAAFSGGGATTTTTASSSDPSDPFAAFSAGSVAAQPAKSDTEKKDPFAAFADFSNSTFDFSSGFKQQPSSSATKTTAATSSSILTPAATTSATLATSLTPTPQPATSPQPLQPSPLTVQPSLQASTESKPAASQDAVSTAAMSAQSATNQSPSPVPPLPKNVKSVLSQYEALYQFDAEGPDELSIKPGDIILVGKNQSGEPGWLGGELNGKTGWFPENYAKKLPSPPTTPLKPPAENGLVFTTSDAPSWAGFDQQIKKTEEIKQQSAPSPSLAASVTPASSSLTPTPVPAPRQELKQSPAPVPQPASKPAPEPTPEQQASEPTPKSEPSKHSVSALAAAFTAAAEASTVPQVSSPKPIFAPADASEVRKVEEAKADEPKAEEPKMAEQKAEEPKAEARVSASPGLGAAAPASASSFTKVVPQSGPTSSPIPNLGVKEPEGTEVKALYDWDAKKENHLSFKAGDVITVLEKQDMWWLGRIDGRRGWFPKAHVQFLDDVAPEGSSHTFTQEKDPSAFAIYANTPKPPQESAFALYANTPKVTKQPTPPPEQPQKQQQQQQPPPLAATSASPSLQLQENNIPQQQETASAESYETCVSLFAYSSEEPGDLIFEADETITVVKKEGEWWTGRIGDREGMFPSNYVRLSAAPEAASQPPPSAKSLAPPAPQIVPAETAAKTGSLSKKPEIAKVLASYQATGTEQLSLEAGQLIMVRKKSPSGWWQGELQARGKKRQMGWFPANYVKLMESGGRLTPTPSDPSKSPNLGLAAPSQAEQRLTPGIDMVCQVITLYQYAKQNDDELSFQKGMVINVLNKDDPDWWRGELNGSEGVFPSNYVQEIGDSKSGPATDWTRDLHVLESMSDMERHRQGRIHELIQTEQKYVDDMQLAVEVFQRPILDSGMMSVQEMASVFVNWKELIQCNTKLLKALRVRKKMSGEEKPVHMIGDILCEQLPRMTPYIRFCSCQLSASNTLSKKIDNDPDFREYVKQLALDQRTKGMPVSSYLIKPMQRITRYPLLVQKILKYTPEGHADYGNIRMATEKAEELCQQVNEGVREKENSDRLEWLQNHVDCTGLAEELIFNSLTNCLGPRKYLHSGKLHKAKSNKELYVFLFNDFLLFTQPVKPGLRAPFLAGDSKIAIEYKMYKHPLFLNEVEVKIPDETAPDDFVFHINHIDKVYALRSESKKDRTKWQERIQQASKNYVETEKKKREKLQRARSQRSKGVGRLMVVIIEGYELKPSNSVTGRADPYCEVSMGSQEHKTRVVPDNLNPVWDSSMQFIVRDLQEDVLCITVYDRDFFSPNDFLGRTEVRVADILKETQGRGPVIKSLLLHEVSTGEVKVKLTLHLFDQS